MKLLRRLSTIVLIASLSLAALVGLVNVGQAQDAPMAPEITAGISGTVYDSAGQPLANIEVTAMSQEQYSWWSTVKSTKTDASGAYTLSYLNTGIYRLRFRDERGQFLTIYHPNAMEVESALDIPVAGTDVTGLQTYLRPMLLIAGVVTDDSGQPLPDIDVSAYRQSSYGSWPFERSATTDASGAYTLTRLYPATYRLGLRDPQEQFTPRFHPDAQNVESAQDILVSDADVIGIRTSLQRSAQITGAVSMWDGSHPDSALVTVYAPENGEWKRVKEQYLYSNSDGVMRYAVIGLPPGRYRIGVRGGDSNGYVTNYYDEFYNDAVTVQAADDVLLEIGDTVPDVNFVLGDNPHLSNVSGAVTTREGAGLPGIVVTALISGTRGWQEIHSARTITDGAYTLRALPAGSYTVRFHDPLRNFVAEYYDDEATVDSATLLSITGESDLTGINAGLTPTGRIVAEITMYDGRPPRYAEVMAYSAADGYDKLVDRVSVDSSTGQPVTITLPALAPGAYRLYIAADDENNTYSEYYNDALLIENAADVPVLSGEATEIHAVLGENPGYARISGTVRSSDSTPLADIKVTALYQNYPVYGLWQQRQSTFTDQSGDYSLWALTPNTYTVKFEDPDGGYITQYYTGAADEQSATRIRMEGGQTRTGMDAVLAQTGMLTGMVTLYDGRPPAWGSVTLYRWTTEYGWSSYRPPISLGYPKPTSSYRFTQLPTGVYRVGVSASFGDGENYESRFYDAAPTFEDAVDITVTDGATTPNINFFFGQDKRDARIEGQVYADGNALPGMRVDLYTNKGYGNWWRLVYVATDALGAFRINGLLAGEYRICVADPDQLRATLCYPGVDDLAGAFTFYLADGQVLSDLRIEMVRLEHWAYLPIIGRIDQ